MRKLTTYIVFAVLYSVIGGVISLAGEASTNAIVVQSAEIAGLLLGSAVAIRIAGRVGPVSGVGLLISTASVLAAVYGLTWAIHYRVVSAGGGGFPSRQVAMFGGWELACSVAVIVLAPLFWAMAFRWWDVRRAARAVA